MSSSALGSSRATNSILASLIKGSARSRKIPSSAIATARLASDGEMLLAISNPLTPGSNGRDAPSGNVTKIKAFAPFCSLADTNRRMLLLALSAVPPILNPRNLFFNPTGRASVPCHPEALWRRGERHSVAPQKHNRCRQTNALLRRVFLLLQYRQSCALLLRNLQQRLRNCSLMNDHIHI